MKNDAALIYLVDDDEAVRDALGILFKSIGLKMRKLKARSLAELVHAVDKVSPAAVRLQIG